MDRKGRGRGYIQHQEKGVAGRAPVYRGTPYRYNPIWNVGVMGLAGSGIGIDEARSLAASYTNELRQAKNRQFITDARAANATASKSEIARVTGLDRHAVGRHWK